VRSRGCRFFRGKVTPGSHRIFTRTRSSRCVAATLATEACNISAIPSRKGPRLWSFAMNGVRSIAFATEFCSGALMLPFGGSALSVSGRTVSKRHAISGLSMIVTRRLIRLVSPSTSLRCITFLTLPEEVFFRSPLLCTVGFVPHCF